MSIETELKKEGIEVLEQIDTLTVNSIAKNVSEKLAETFPEQNLSVKELFIALSRLTMYRAKMPTGLSKANYYYKNRSIYFSEDIDLTTLNIYVMHECLHYLQELRDNKDHLIQLGLCDFTSARLPGMALNEAAVQLMSAKALNLQQDSVKYFDITLPTYSPSHYALECNLLFQMAYITGNDVLVNSTLYSNTNFKNTFVALTNAKTYSKIERNMDQLMDLEDHLGFQTTLLENTEDSDKAISKIVAKISTLRQKIQQLFLATQNLILTSYFNANFKTLNTIEQLEHYRRNLYSYIDVIGSTSTYSFFNDYYIQKMTLLEAKRTVLENSLSQTTEAISLVPVKHNLILDMFRKLKRLFLRNREYQSIQENENR